MVEIRTPPDSGNLSVREKYQYTHVQPEWRRTELCNFLDPFNFGQRKRFPHLSRRCSARTIFVPFVRENSTSGAPGRRIRLRKAGQADDDDVDDDDDGSDLTPQESG